MSVGETISRVRCGVLGVVEVRSQDTWCAVRDGQGISLT
jgi:hypothetical protein